VYGKIFPAGFQKNILKYTGNLSYRFQKAEQGEYITRRLSII